MCEYIISLISSRNNQKREIHEALIRILHQSTQRAAMCPYPDLADLTHIAILKTVDHTGAEM